MALREDADALMCAWGELPRRPRRTLFRVGSRRSALGAFCFAHGTLLEKSRYFFGGITLGVEVSVRLQLPAQAADTPP